MKTFQILSNFGGTLALVKASYPEDALETYAKEKAEEMNWNDVQSWADLTARVLHCTPDWNLDPDGIHILTSI